MFLVRCGLMSLELAERTIADIWRLVEERGARAPMLACRFPEHGLVELAFDCDARVDRGVAHLLGRVEGTRYRRFLGYRTRRHASSSSGTRRVRDATRAPARSTSRRLSD
jgi:hypothetical protein